MSTYYARHREEMLERQREYHLENRDACLAYFRKYYATVLKPKRQLERQHNGTRWSVKPLPAEGRRAVRHVKAPRPPKKSKPIQQARPGESILMSTLEPATTQVLSAPLVTLGGPRVIVWE